jgi:hypothetical protein
MKVQAEIKRIDLLRAIVATTFRSRHTYATILIATGFILWICSFNDDFDNSFSWWFAYSILSLGFALIGFMFSVTLSLLFSLFSSPFHRGVLGLHEFEICKDGFLEKTNINEDKIRWKGINDIRISRSSILLIKNNYFFYIIPKRGFSSEQEFTEFANKARTAWSAAQRQPAG